MMMNQPVSAAAPARTVITCHRAFMSLALIVAERAPLIFRMMVSFHFAPEPLDGYRSHQSPHGSFDAMNRHSAWRTCVASEFF
jgi:hypothetical protein